MGAFPVAGEALPAAGGAIPAVGCTVNLLGQFLNVNLRGQFLNVNLRGHFLNVNLRGKLPTGRFLGSPENSNPSRSPKKINLQLFSKMKNGIFGPIRAPGPSGTLAKKKSL